ncbi:UDP-N-acetylglucosamine 1-carboxyvinyltransferase [cf. Phormidesmis sp. LEGE 11477]|uniref:UDP-N-acetylglucosamine 1-carboxyvinyltransferase n=1 Tax=cf. Phormidesmis sp. LEGE 11477 TaxID=1828680 RepID=UPI00187E7B94|nr:UDP-N-acetylglucosamine 1-carboxyvinyltransferase [cf. Phormidesmis sp. LEGE 11477]MBE9061263.1 UDP-N-acetylglucosamine 1-carboxyvinyltransferase [cf. Phormidesmis sp. LEGE 11477]
MITTRINPKKASSLKMQVAGPQVPSGTVRVSGAKNAATRLMAAAMLTDEPVVLLNFPTGLVDARHKARFIEAMSGEVTFDTPGSTAFLNCADFEARQLEDYDFPIRTTYLLAAGQLNRQGIAYVPYPGGCKLGDRKYDLHLMVWESLGCRVEEKSDHIEVSGRLLGGDIHFPLSTVGGTENALLCTSVAKGTSRIHNAYITPEIENLIDLLTLMGAKISVRGISLIEVEGVEQLRGATIPVIPDRIEALTWLVFAAVSGGDVLVENVPFSMMEIPLLHLQKAGIDYFANSTSVWVSARAKAQADIQPFEVACGTHPGIISDMQPFFTLLALHAKGRSLVVDYRYPDRTAYLEQLSKIYSDSITFESGKIVIEGSKKPTGAVVTSTDLRGSMALVLAGILAEGESEVKDVTMALRGYDQMKEKLASLGIDIAIGA